MKTMFKKPKRKSTWKPFRHIPQVNTYWKDMKSFKLLLNRYKSGAYIRHLEFGLTEERFHEITTNDCHYCGISPFRYIETEEDKYVYNGIDRIDSKKGYIESNVVSCCAECNWMKLDTPYNEFIDRIKAIYSRLCFR